MHSSRKFAKPILVLLILLSFAAAAVALSHTTIKSYPAGGFAPGWTHIAYTPNGVLYYNSHTGAGAVGRIDCYSNGNHVTIKSYPAGAFAPGWTNIVNTSNGILYYNSATGAGAIGSIDGAGNHTTVASYGAGSFAPGWLRRSGRPDGDQVVDEPEVGHVVRD